MSLNRSWKWLAPRLSIRAMWSSRETTRPARPCIACIEPLGDRVLLDATLPGEPTNTSPEQILIGLLKGSIGQPGREGSLLQSQLDFLKIAAAMPDGLKLMESHKLTDAFLKINTILSKVALGDIKGESTDDKHKGEILIEFAKLDSLIQGLGADDLLLQAVESVADSTYKLFDTLTSFGPLNKLDSKLLTVYSKIAGDFTDVSNGLLKLGEDVLFRKAGKGQQEYLQIKLDTVLVSSYKLIEDDFKSKLQEFALTAVDTMNSLLQPPILSPDRDATGPFTGGVSVVGEIVDDVIQ